MPTVYRFPCGCQWPVVGPAPRQGALPLLDVDDENLPFCRATWELLGRGDTKGVFQLESNLGRQWTKKLRPESGEHMGALGALLRPGCMRAVDDEGVSMTQHYCRRKNNEEDVKPYHPAIDWILKPTYGTLCFQEQAMEIVKAVAGFNLQEADQLRKAAGKKLPEEMAKVKKMFLEGTAKTGILDSEQAKEVFGWIEKSQRYSFNKCISELECILRPNGGKYGPAAQFTVAEMYRIRHDLVYAKATGHDILRRKWKRLGNYGKGLSMYEDGRIRPNTLVDIRPAGKRVVYLLTLENGATIRATGNHKFPTTRGEQTVWQMLDRITDNVYGTQDPIHLFVCGKYESTGFRPCDRFSDATLEERRSRAQGKRIAGQKGEANYAYTNGSYTEFKKNSTLIERRCAGCGKTEGRLELHHRDGNRSDSGMDNLVRLCSSCHKKFEYAAGRTKRGEKGYPSVQVRLVAIKPDGEEETYDVEMAGPAHNFVTASGVVTCNSHAVSYGITGYDTAYIKAHFPVQFYCSWLRFARDKQDPLQEIYELVNDAKLNDVEVRPPDLRNMEPHFATDGVMVTFGLSDIKGVGVNQVVKVRDVIEHAEKELGKPLAQWTWNEFLFFVSHRLNTGTVERLARVGALSWMGVGRQRMQKEFASWSELTACERGWIVARERLARGLCQATDLASALPPEPEAPVIEELSPNLYGHLPAGDRQKLLNLEQTKRLKKARTRYRTAQKAWQKKADARQHFLESLVAQKPFVDVAAAIAACGQTRKEGGGATSKRVETLQGMAYLLEHPSSPLDDRPDQIAWDEEQFLGIALTCNRVDAFNQRDVNTSCKDFLAGKTGYMVFGVTIEQVREVKTRRGKNPGQKMAFLTVSDGSCSLSDVICFPDVWKECGGLLREENCVIFQGERDHKQGTLVVKKVCQMER